MVHYAKTVFKLDKSEKKVTIFESLSITRPVSTSPPPHLEIRFKLSNHVSCQNRTLEPRNIALLSGQGERKDV